jgi:hypothetical protein
MRALASLTVAVALVACPSLGPVKIACRTNEDCPEGLACLGGFCSAFGEGGGGGVAATGGGAGGGAGGTDAGSDAGVDAGSDAGSDAGVDAGHDAGRDAGTDAGSDGGFDAGVRFCDGPGAGHWFCEDFDAPDADVDFTRWTWTSTDDAGRPRVDTSQAHSPPRSLLAYMMPRSGTCFFSDANLTQSTPHRHAVEELSVRFAPGSQSVFGAVNINTAAVGACIGAIWVTNNKFGVLEQGYDNTMATVTYSNSHFSSVPVPVDTWVHLRFEYDIAASHVKLYVDGGLAIDEAFQTTCPYPNPDSTTFRVGEMCVDNPGTLMQIWYDDITFDSQ